MPDPEEFRAKLEASFDRLQIDKIDLFAFHGLNNAEQLAMVLQGGCLEIAQGRWWRKSGAGAGAEDAQQPHQRERDVGDVKY